MNGDIFNVSIQHKVPPTGIWCETYFLVNTTSNQTGTATINDKYWCAPEYIDSNSFLDSM